MVLSKIVATGFRNGEKHAAGFQQGDNGAK